MTNDTLHKLDQIIDLSKRHEKEYLAYFKEEYALIALQNTMLRILTVVVICDLILSALTIVFR